MKFTGRLILAFLVISLVSYGISGAAYAAVEPLTVTTNKEFYATGGKVIISGSVKDYDTSDPMTSHDVSITIIAPNGNLVTILQITPDQNGNYSKEFTAGGMMKDDGDYTVKAQWGPQSNETQFKFSPVGAAASSTEEEPIQVKETTEVDEEPDKEPVVDMTQPTCGPGTVLKNGLCVAEQQKSGGCLIATAAFGSELAPQVQLLREIRDNTVLETQSGSAFMTGFNHFYYSFSPTIADYERENVAFKETVKIAITPMLTSLAILNYVDIDSEEEMLGYGIGIILLNIGMYFVAPAVVIFKIRNRK